MSAAKLYYRSDDEIEAVVRGFESCATVPAVFDHCAHLTVAFSYLQCSNLNIAEAKERMRVGLYRFLDHNGVDRQKYNETITLFWIRLVHSFLAARGTKQCIADVVNEMLEALGNAQLIFDYYSIELLS